MLKSDERLLKSDECGKVSRLNVGEEGKRKRFFSKTESGDETE